MSQFIDLFGRLPQTWKILVLMTLSGLFEGAGIALFIPVLDMISGQQNESEISALTLSVMQYFGITAVIPALLLSLILLVVGAFALNYWQARTVAHSTFVFIADLRHRMYRDLLGSQWEYLSQQSHGDVINQQLTECIRYAFTLMFQIKLVSTSLLLVIFFGISAAISIELLLLALIAGGAFVYFLRPLMSDADRLGKELTVANQELAFHAMDFLRGARLIKTSAAEQAITDRFERYNRRHFQVIFETEELRERTYFLMQSLPVAVVVGMIYFAHSSLELDTASLLAFIALMSRLMPRVVQVQQFYQQYLLRRPAVALMDKTFFELVEHGERSSGDTLSAATPINQVSLKNVSYTFPGEERKALEDINISVDANKFIALVGTSGGGKSTLLDIITGLRSPTTGEVIVNDERLADLKLESWRSRIGYVSQDPVIFNDTVRANLLFVRPNADSEMIESALRKAHFLPTLETMENGLDTVLGEGGARLSGGQKQRLAIARVMLLEPDVLVLDEATSALDSEAEQAIKEALQNLSHRTTIIAVAHRLSTIRQADTIYVIEAGRVKESGSFESLMSAGGRFHDLYEKQFS